MVLKPSQGHNDDGVQLVESGIHSLDCSLVVKVARLIS